MNSMTNIVCTMIMINMTSTIRITTQIRTNIATASMRIVTINRKLNNMITTHMSVEIAVHPHKAAAGHWLDTTRLVRRRLRRMRRVLLALRGQPKTPQRVCASAAKKEAAATQNALELLRVMAICRCFRTWYCPLFKV